MVFATESRVPTDAARMASLQTNLPREWNDVICWLAALLQQHGRSPVHRGTIENENIIWRTRNRYMQRCCELARCYIAVSAQRDRQEVKKHAVDAGWRGVQTPESGGVWWTLDIVHSLSRNWGHRNSITRKNSSLTMQADIGLWCNCSLSQHNAEWHAVRKKESDWLRRSCTGSRRTEKRNHQWKTVWFRKV